MMSLQTIQRGTTQGKTVSAPDRDAKQPAATTPKPVVASKDTFEPRKTAPKQPELNPVASLQTAEVKKRDFAPLPPGFKNGGGSDKKMLSALELAPDAETGRRWIQEMQGAKVDGKFGPETAKALKEFPTVVEELRRQRLAETPGAMTKPLAPIDAKATQQLKDALTTTRDTSGYEAAVIQMQQRLQRKGEPLEADGKLGKQTYESMVRVYGRKTADDLSRHLGMLKSEDGNC